MSIVPLFGPIPGGPELLIIVLVLVLLFGANKIPKLARSSGQAIGEFKKGREEMEAELRDVAGAADEDDEDDHVDEAATSAEPATETEIADDQSR
ncbi:twin-arginine translocase TatA/TatE family subunit [Haloferacaceae archaeon DSL9]